MKKTLLMYAQYTKKSNQTVFSILDKFSFEELQKDRNSYYKNLLGLAAHISGGVLYFQGMFKASLPQSVKALQAFDALNNLAFPQEITTQAQWKEFIKFAETADDVLIKFVQDLTDDELNLPVKIEWYGGNPSSVPLYFLLNQFITHGIHHRGQISQILDELKIEHDFSSIDIAFLPK